MRLTQVTSKLVHARAFTHAVKGRPHVVRSVQPLFRLPRGSTPRSIRERVEFLKLACLHWGLGTVYYRAT